MIRNSVVLPPDLGAGGVVTQLTIGARPGSRSGSGGSKRSDQVGREKVAAQDRQNFALRREASDERRTQSKSDAACAFMLRDIEQLASQAAQFAGSTPGESSSSAPTCCGETRWSSSRRFLRNPVAASFFTRSPQHRAHPLDSHSNKVGSSRRRQFNHSDTNLDPLSSAATPTRNSGRDRRKTVPSLRKFDLSAPMTNRSSNFNHDRSRKISTLASSGSSGRRISEIET